MKKSRPIASSFGNYPKIPSSPKPAVLRQSISQFQDGKISREELSRIEREVTAEVISEQEKAGLDVVTDGQIRWEDLVTYIAKGLSGVSFTGLIRYFETNCYYRQPVIEGKVRWQGPITASDFEFAKSKSKKPVKVCLPGPLTLFRLSKNKFYKTEEEALLDLAAVLNQEARALSQTGCSLIQFDEPSLTKEAKSLKGYGRICKILTDGVSAKTAMATYFGDLSGISPENLFSLPVDGIGLDLANEPGNWKIVEADGFGGKMLLAGLVDAQNTKMESASEISKKIQRLLKILGNKPGRLQVQPTCGLEFLPRDRAFQKIRVLAQAVKKA